MAAAKRCGSCTPCAPPAHSTATCTGGQCGFVCNATYHECSGQCASNSSTDACGSSCTACTPPANAAATCDGTSCDFSCDPEYARSGASCVLAGTWTAQTSGVPVGAYLMGVWGSGSGDVYAVGENGTILHRVQ